MYLLPLLWVAGVMAEEVDPFEKPDCDPEMLKEFEETLPSETVIEHTILFCDPSLFSYIYISSIVLRSPYNTTLYAHPEHLEVQGPFYFVCIGDCCKSCLESLWC